MGSRDLIIRSIIVQGNTSGADEVCPPTGFCSIFVPVVEPDFHELWMRTIISGTQVLLSNRGKRAVVQLDVLVEVYCRLECRQNTSQSQFAGRDRTCYTYSRAGSVIHDTRHGPLLNV